MRKKFLVVVIVAIFASPASAVDQKSLLLGVAIGLGVYTVQRGVVPSMVSVGRGVKVAAKHTGRGVRRALRGPKKKNPNPPVAAQ